MPRSPGSPDQTRPPRGGFRRSDGSRRGGGARRSALRSPAALALLLASCAPGPRIADLRGARAWTPPAGPVPCTVASASGNLQTPSLLAPRQIADFRKESGILLRAPDVSAFVEWDLCRESDPTPVLALVLFEIRPEALDHPYDISRPVDVVPLDTLRIPLPPGPFREMHGEPFRRYPSLEVVAVGDLPATSWEAVRDEHGNRARCASAAWNILLGQAWKAGAARNRRIRLEVEWGWNGEPWNRTVVLDLDQGRLLPETSP